MGRENGESRILMKTFCSSPKIANVLKSGVKSGDRVTIYLPMVPELPIAMLGLCKNWCNTYGSFSGFSATSIKDRIDDSKSKVVITADGGFRTKICKLKEVIDEAIQGFDFVEHVVVLERTKNEITLS